MGQSYQQLSLEDRCEIASRRAGGVSIRQTAGSGSRAIERLSGVERNGGSSAYRLGYAGESRHP